MRRSKAPSQISKIVSPSVNVKPKSDLTAKTDTLKIEGSSKSNTSACRSRENILHLLGKLSKTEEPKIESPFRLDVKNGRLQDTDVLNGTQEEKKETATVPDSNVPTNLRIYIVVYGKQSKKKHKTWEGDGTLEVESKSATLKDEAGKIIGHSSNLKISILEEGSRIFVGSKEVEIMELTKGPAEANKKRCNEEEEDVAPVIIHKPKKKLKKSTSIGLPSLETNVASYTRPKLSKLHSPYEPLVLPQPPDIHKWERNISHLPLTDVIVEPSLCRVLRPHQREGLVFLYRCITGMRCLKNTGAILADEMGLGKTLQCVALIWTLMNGGPYGGRPFLKRTLIVVPSSLTQNWKNEIIRWIGSHRINVFLVDKKNRPSDYAKNLHIPILIISYEMFMRSYEDIRDVEFDLLICDEGHRLKNGTIRTTNLLNEIQCRSRILLTGTPFQNDLQEFYALIDFANPGLLGTPLDFKRRFTEPIVRSREASSSEEVTSLGVERAEELGRLTSGFILRRTQAVLDSFLPHKTDYVLFCRPSSLQKSIYRAATDHWFRLSEERLNTRDMVAHLSVIHALKKICNHPCLIKSDSLDCASDEDDLYRILNAKLSQHGLADDLTYYSGKLMVLDSMLKSLHSSKERVVVVSNFTQTLDLLEKMCNSRGYKYLRFDGSTPTSQRNDIVQRFNNSGSDIYILLLSSKAGGVGLNLIGASRLVLYDSDWNPATDLQAMARIWRDGQKRRVHIYRLLTCGTIEEKIFQRQLNKAGLSESVVDPSSSSSVKLSMDELKDLFTFTGEDKCTTHDSLKCSCSGDGSMPELQAAEVGLSRDADLMAVDDSLPQQMIRMNQLYQWEHHAPPIHKPILYDMGVEASSDWINFIFRNKTF